MMEEINERIWIVSQHLADGTAEVSAFDNEADAVNFYDETLESTDESICESVRIGNTILMRRNEVIHDNEAPWGLLGADINKELVEGLMEEIVPKDKLPAGAAERFILEKSEEVRRRARKKFDDYLKDELHTCIDEWCKVDMEY